jgi:hypothetical protein
MTWALTFSRAVRHWGVKKKDIKVRRSWGALKPVTRVRQSKKIYSRKGNKL